MPLGANGGGSASDFWTFCLASCCLAAACLGAARRGAFMTRLVRIAALLSVWCAGVFASPPRSTMAFAHKSGLVIRAAALPRLHGAFRSQTRKLSNLQIAKGSISTLYQAKGRTEESLKAFAPRLAAKKFELDVALLLKLEAERKEAQTLASELQAERNSKSKMIGMMKGKGEDTTAIMAEVDGLKAKTSEAEEREKTVSQQIEDFLAQVPNAPHVCKRGTAV